MGKIVKITGPVVVASGMRESKIYDVALVGHLGLLGEVIQLKGDRAVIQVYENTSGLKPGGGVKDTGMPLSVDLGPGLMSTIYDGIGRPLAEVARQSGDFIAKGVNANTLDRKRKYDFRPKVKAGDKVSFGTVLGEVPETALVTHRILVPRDVDEGRVTSIKKGSFTIEDTVAVVRTKKGTHKIKMYQRWPVRRPRPIVEKLKPGIPLVTGQRVFDTFFPLAKGGTAAIPGPFGAGKTVSQHQLAKWSDAQIVVYVGCGERGNEMTDVLTDFPKLVDPMSGKPLMDRTVLIANTSNMPVAAREASIYTGITIAEYFRDMGYDVALMADSTSRWAEALREISSRLEEMPGEEGYPAYLGSRLAQFYERACRVKTLSGKEGSVTVVGAISPPGGDFSEPVTQNTMRLTKILWGLDANLAYSRHFPAINWLTSYSLYKRTLSDYFESQVGPDFNELRENAIALLQKESELKEIVQLVGPDALSEEDKLVMYAAERLREDFLQQLATHEVDTFCPLKKQYLMLKVIMDTHGKARSLVDSGIKLAQISVLPLTEMLGRMKYAKDYEENIRKVGAERDKQFGNLAGGNR